LAELSPEQLEEAFALFSQASAELTNAYEGLQGRVEQLTGELAATNRELRVQLAAKAALSERLEALLAALPGGVVVLDAAGQVTGTNPAAMQLLAGARMGESWTAVVAAALRSTAAPDEHELRVPGESCARRVRLSRSSLPDGGAIVLLNDVTAAHALTAQLERARRLSAMGEMAARLAHNLRTPLATALLYAGNLARPGLAEAERSRFAEKTVDCLRRVERMIQDMLRFVRGQHDAFEPIAIDALLAELAAVIDPQMTRRGVAFEVLDDSAGATLHGDRKAIAGALLNLLENALHATEAGGSITLAAQARPGAVELSVLDTGSGIAPEVAERLFEPFFTTRTDGTGLGLAIVRGVATAHGGEAVASRREPRGSQFTLRLPLSAAAVAASVSGAA